MILVIGESILEVDIHLLEIDRHAGVPVVGEETYNRRPSGGSLLSAQIRMCDNEASFVSPSMIEVANYKINGKDLYKKITQGHELDDASVLHSLDSVAKDPEVIVLYQHGLRFIKEVHERYPNIYKMGIPGEYQPPEVCPDIDCVVVKNDIYHQHNWHQFPCVVHMRSPMEMTGYDHHHKLIVYCQKRYDEPVDARGDIETASGALAASLSMRTSFEEAVRFANVVANRSSQKEGPVTVDISEMT